MLANPTAKADAALCCSRRFKNEFQSWKNGHEISHTCTNAQAQKSLID